MTAKTTICSPDGAPLIRRWDEGTVPSRSWLLLGGAECFCWVGKGLAAGGAAFVDDADVLKGARRVVAATDLDLAEARSALAVEYVARGPCRQVLALRPKPWVTFRSADKLGSRASGKCAV